MSKKSNPVFSISIRCRSMHQSLTYAVGRYNDVMRRWRVEVCERCLLFNHERTSRHCRELPAPRARGEKGRKKNEQVVGNLFSRNSRQCHSERPRRISRFLYLAKTSSFG